MSFIPAIVLGFMGSLHCLGMCGPIAFMLPLDRGNRWKSILQLSIYHFGRLSAYMCIGLVFGSLGTGFALFGFQQKISIAIGALMILSVLLPIKGLLNSVLAKPFYKAISKVKNRLGKELNKRSPDAFLLAGFFNGLLPCGLVYMAVLGALAMGHPIDGSLFMITFGLGTVPMMSSAAYLGNFAKASVRLRLQKLIPVVVVLIGILFILRGMGLGIPYLSPAPPSILKVDALNCLG